MRITKWYYPIYEKTDFTDRTVIREFHRWRALSAKRGNRLLIILDEYVRRQVTICTYNDDRERDEDIRVLQEISPFPPPSEGSGAGPAAAAMCTPIAVTEENAETSWKTDMVQDRPVESCLLVPHLVARDSTGLALPYPGSSVG